MNAWPRSDSLDCVVRVAALGLLLFCGVALGAPRTITARSRTITAQLRAYAEVEPISVARLAAAHAGVITGVTVIPGQAVDASELLGRLEGPEIAAELARRRSAVGSANAALKAARRVLTIERQERALKLSTRRALYQGEASVAQAQARLTSAQASLLAAEHGADLMAPATGTVISLAAANGERVAAGQTVLTIQPTDHLWLKAVYYGAASGAPRVGMEGQFLPADGSPPIAVSVASVLSPVQPDGGRPVGLRPVRDRVSWVSGEAGTVILKGTTHSIIMVPTRALILDRGQWWVLVHTPKGDQRQAVTPGARRGEETAIKHGLAAGAEVVVDHVYTTFHHDVSQHYLPPD